MMVVPCRDCADRSGPLIPCLICGGARVEVVRAEIGVRIPLPTIDGPEDAAYDRERDRAVGL